MISRRLRNIMPGGGGRGNSGRTSRVIDEPYMAWIREQKCLLRLLGLVERGLVVPCWGRVQCAHVKSRGAGGGDDQTIPLCVRHHGYQHQRGITRIFTSSEVQYVQKEWGVDLLAEAKVLRAIYENQMSDEQEGKR